MRFPHSQADVRHGYPQVGHTWLRDVASAATLSGMPARIPPELAALLELQRGVLSRDQALSGGLTTDEVRSRLRSGRWQLLHRGVYAAFSGPAGREPLLWAAVLRAGDGAVLSHHTAAELDGLADRAAPTIHVTVPARRRTVPIDGAVVHLSTQASQRTHPARIPPRTRVEETVFDLTDLALTVDDACGWVTRALGRRLTIAAHLRAAMAGRSRLRWRDELSELLAADAHGVHSSLEYRYVRDVEHRHRLPHGRRQARVASASRSGYRDVLYDGYGLVVELDGQAAHPGDTRWADIRRDNAAAALGLVTLRYGWLDVSQHPCRCAVQVVQALSVRGWPSCRPCSAKCPAPAIG